jgi:hypothetical protein
MKDDGSTAPERIGDVVGRCLKWLESVQIKTDKFHGGGFPPYPQTVKAAGTLATSDVVISCQRAGLERPRLISEAVEFLLRIQMKPVEGATDSEGGGFPPMGDFELIVKTPFTDSTADAVLALMAVYGSAPAGLSQAALWASIENGMGWLLRRWDEVKGSPLPTYAVSGRYPTSPRRYFPTLLAGIAFARYCEEHRNDHLEAAERALETIVADACETLNKHNCLPFQQDGWDRPSITNSALALQLLHLYSGQASNDRLQKAIGKGSAWLLEQAQRLSRLETPEAADLTDYDHVAITVPEIGESRYPATYFTLPLLVSGLDRVPGPEARDLRDRLLHRLLAMAKSDNTFAYYCERRGIDEPATSATASAMYTLTAYTQEASG